MKDQRQKAWDRIREINEDIRKDISPKTFEKLQKEKARLEKKYGIGQS